MDRFENELDLWQFGRQLVKARNEQGLTCTELACRCNITPVHVRHMEGGSRLPSLPVLISLCNALKVSPTYFLGDYLECQNADVCERVRHLLLSVPPQQAEIITAMLETMNQHLQISRENAAMDFEQFLKERVYPANYANAPKELVDRHMSIVDKMTALYRETGTLNSDEMLELHRQVSEINQEIMKYM